MSNRNSVLLDKYKRHRRVRSSEDYRVSKRSILTEATSVAELYYLSQIGKRNSDSLSATLPLVLGSDAYSKMIAYYGGTSIHIPDIDEVQDDLIGVMSYYYHDIQGLSWDSTLAKLNLPLTNKTKNITTRRYNAFKSSITESGIYIPSNLTELSTEVESQVLEDNQSPSSLVSSRSVRCVDGRHVSVEDYESVATTVMDQLVGLGVISESVVARVLSQVSSIDDEGGDDNE